MPIKTIVLIFLVLSLLQRAAAQFKFQEHSIATDLRGGYQVVFEWRWQYGCRVHRFSDDEFEMV